MKVTSVSTDGSGNRRDGEGTFNHNERVNYVTSVGMEVHAELLTQSKMFCRCRNEFGGEVNTRVCPTCLGLPGAMPVINRQVVEHVLRTALAMNCTIAMHSVFHRKNYFYPDLSQGFQISQYEETNPIGYKGWLDIPAGDDGAEIKRVSLRRVHLEEDTGKLMHLPAGKSGVDFNRSGVPLMEIVTDFPPDIHTPAEAREYLQQLRLLLVYLGVCDGKMEQGSMRCEPNVSIAPEGADELGTKTELKNLGSFRAVSSGIEYEGRRMAALLAQGETLKQETRGWNEETESSFPMRVKEHESDYRYFTEPDLPPMEFDEAYIEELRSGLPELPMAKRARYMSGLGLSAYDAGVLIQEPQWAAYYDEALKGGADPKALCNWMNGDFSRLLNETKTPLAESRVKPVHLTDLVSLISGDAISGKTAKEVFETVFETGEMPSAIVEKKGLSQISDTSAILEAVQAVIAENPDVVARFKEGKGNVKGFFVGQVIKRTQGRANADLVNSILEQELSK
jgi:aspartyl-tRNA(Asn)/glutamyl-tRNA(Gln) amidotransferase subunit B